MDKVIQPWGWTGAGDGQPPELFEILDPYNLRHGQLQKVACGVHPSVFQYIDRVIKPETIKDSPYLYVLCSNMGAGESWGSNINADRFSRSVLAYHGDDWGIQTFKKSGIFKHHKNKDMTKSYGNIPFVVFASAIDGYMDRVESIVVIDREKAAKVGAEDVPQAIDRGEFPAWSMGCRVKYDVCSYCGNKAKTRKDYCIHMRRYPNQIITADFMGREGFSDLTPDQLGLRICVDNPRPVFFDFSRVWVGAAPEAKTLKKVANMDVIPSAELADMVFKGAADKTSAITKQIEPGQGDMVGKSLKIFSGQERDIPRDILDAMGAAGLPAALSTSGLMGMVLRPKEFQRVTLISGGHRDLADKLDSMGSVFSPSKKIQSCHAAMAKDFFVKALAHMLLNLVEDRSAYGPVIKRRMIRVALKPGVSMSARPIDDPSLEKISALYNGYRLGLIEKLAEQGPNVLMENPGLLSSVYGPSLEDNLFGLTKQAEGLVTFPTMGYLLHAHGLDIPDLIQNNPGSATVHLRRAAQAVRF